jgi:hypothetical protein
MESFPKEFLNGNTACALGTVQPGAACLRQVRQAGPTISAEVIDMKIARKLMVVAVPAVLVAGVTSAIAVSAKTPASHAAAAPAAVTNSAAANGAASGKPEVETADSAAAPAAAGTKAATKTETDVAGGHTDEAPGATTESNVDHQFNGEE